MSSEQTLVSYQSLASALRGNFESVASAAESVVGPDEPAVPGSQAEMVAQLSHALDTLEQEETNPNVMMTSQDQVASLLQTYVAEKATEAGQVEPLASGGLEAKFDGHDFLGWAGSFFQWWKKLVPHPFLSAPDEPETLANSARVAMFGDWGSGLYGAPVCARSIEDDADGFHLIVHLADIYYSGLRREVEKRFLAFWPEVDGAVNRALFGNHEMYCGGRGYFKDVIPAFEQDASYFAIQNDFWTLVGLDTGYKDHQLAGDQVSWLNGILAQAEDRKVILLSHHQPFSLLGSQGPKLVRDLGPVLESRRIFAWYWGHEHRCVLHDPHPLWGFQGRCMGHGGFPQFRDDLGEIPSSPQWKRLNAKNLVPGGKILDGPNVHIPGHENEYNPHGYLALEFDDQHLVELVYDADGTLLNEQEMA